MVRGGGYGIGLTQASNVTVTNNWVGMDYHGLELANITGATITGNKLGAPTPISGNQAGNTFSNNTTLIGNYSNGYPGAPTLF